MAAVALAALSSPDALRSALAATASALLEATPFVLAGIAAARVLPGRAVVEHLGCGCGDGPSARSLPAAAAAWLVFGAPVAVARLLAGLLASRLLRRRSPQCGASGASHPLRELAALLPAAALAGAAMQLLGGIDPARLAPFAQALLGAALGFVAAPCGLGAVALAGALRVRAPLAAAAFLCIAGIADLRALRPRSHAGPGHDAFAYALLAGALAVVAARRGDALVHPALAAPLWCCAVAAAVYAVGHRRERCAAARVAPALMLAGALAGAPPPQYRATETTLTDLFAGERVTFSGALERDGSQSAVVRYAIACCRADAVPVAVRLDRAPPFANGTWVRVDGRIEGAGGDLRLVPARVDRIAPPPDPFLYR